MQISPGLCIIFNESGYNTKPPMSNKGVKLYGLFRINHQYWCSDGVEPTKNQCKVACQKLTDDDIKDDILCAKKILEMSMSLKAWPVWQRMCYMKDLSSYLQGCPL
ncbi:lysozyme C-like [Sceloporus undulatus]|uniref:lysozyme C-like n=1 Tax=Sceloporus undulatus TaxID=8520 RepID=UPI001C4BD15F|nr:lysozyme C-like [Sceloporus undulatus]